MEDGVGEEVTPLDAANGGHLQGKENEFLLRPESCNMLESREMQISGEGDYSTSSHQGFEEMFDRSTKNMRSIGPYHDTPRPMEGSGVTVEELTVRNFGGSNLSIVGTSTSSGIVQTRKNQWQHLYQLGGGSGIRESGRSTATGLEDTGYSSFPEYLAEKASHENPNEVMEELVNSDNVGISGNAAGSIRTKIISKSGFSEFFVKNTLKGKGVIFRCPAQDVIHIDPRNWNNPKPVAGTMAAPDAPREPEAKIITPCLVSTKCKNGGDGCGGVNLREWMRTGCSQAKKIVRLHIFRQIVELVDSSHSQGVALQRLRPSYFELLDSNKVRYLGSPDKKEILQSMMNQALSQSEALARKRLTEQSVFPSVGLSAKKQKFVQSIGAPRPWIHFPVSFRHEVANASQGTVAGQQIAYNEFDEGNLVKRYGTESKFGNPLVSNTREQMISGGEQLEEKWYTSPEESSGGSCTKFSNIYSLGVFLFELLSHFDSESSLATAMSDLRYRILPPNFLSENPKEAGFCLWLLHPEPASRPATRDILVSEVINDLPDVCIEELAASIDQEDAESDLLMHFLALLKERRQKNSSKLADELQCLEADIQEIEKRNRSRSKDYLPCSNLHPQPSVFDRQNTFVHEEPSTNALAQIPKESKLRESIGQIESVYFSMRAKLQIPVNDVTIRQDNDMLSSRENWNLIDKDKERKIPTDRVGAFFDGLCKYARYSRFEVCGVLRNGDFNNSSNFICSLSFDRDEDYFAAAGVSKKIKVFEFNALSNDSVDIHYPVIEMPNNSKLSCVCWNNYIKNYLASTDFDGSVKLWDVSSGQSFSQYNEHERRAWSVDFSKVCPTKLASGSDDCTVKLWNINEKNCLGTIRSVANICCVQFSSHSSYLLAFGSADYRTYCYDLRYGRTPWCVLSGHDKAVSYVKFLDSQTIVSASTDNTLKLWDLNKSTSTGSPNACSLTLSGHTNEKNFVGLSVADGYIACGSESNEVYAYHRSLPMPITSHKFGSIDPISGKETDDDNDQFVSSVCWRKKSEMVVAANSSGCIKVLKMI